VVHFIVIFNEELRAVDLVLIKVRLPVVSVNAFKEFTNWGFAGRGQHKVSLLERCAMYFVPLENLEGD